MASIVESVEYVQCVWDNTSNGSVNLSKGQDEGQCVPFISWEMESGGVANDWREFAHAVDIYDNSGTAAVRIIRTGAADTDDRRTGVFVVEFKSSINVQKHAVALAATDTQDIITITDVGAQDDAFWILTNDYNAAAAVSGPEDTLCRTYFNGASTTQIIVERNNNNNDIAGWIYVVDCDSNEFTVDHQTISVGATEESSTVTISSTVLADTFLIAHAEPQTGSDDMLESAFVVDLQNTTTIRARRTISGAASTTADIDVQIVECQNNEWSVQRGDITMTTTPETASISAVTQANSVVKTGCHASGHYCTGTSDETSGNNNEQISVRASFNSATEIQMERLTDNETGNIVPYEVIDFTGATAVDLARGTLRGVRGIMRGVG